MNEILRLSDILNRGVGVEWFEAVALVREVADRVRENLGGHGVPELQQIELTAAGSVSLSGASRTDEPVRRLGQLLQAVLVQSDPPVQLRLIGSQATAPTPGFASIREYSDALGYFERPDRPGVLRALYERAAAAPAAPVDVTRTLDDLAPLQHREPAKPAATAPARRQPSKRQAVPAFAAAVVIVVGGAAYWQFGAGGTAPSGQRVAELTVKASDAVGTALVAGLSSVTDKVGLGRLASTDSSSVPATPVATSSPAPSNAPRKSVRLKPENVRLFDLAPDVAAGLPTTALPPPALPHVTPPVAPAVERDPDTNVYSASDPEVVGPIGVRPQLPAVLPADVRKENLSQIELLVLPDGTVGAVKLLGHPRSVLEGMLLSAAKAWKFKPAMKGDHPVAYRKLVWLVLE